jgi:hypothetical protein
MARHAWRPKKETDIMNIQRFIRFTTFLLLVGMLAAALTACELTASEGPVTATPVGGNFPIPGTDQNMGGIDVSTFSTQTAQAMITPPIIQQGTPYAPPAVTETPVPAVVVEATTAPVEPAAPVTYVQATRSALPERAKRYRGRPARHHPAHPTVWQLAR